MLTSSLLILLASILHPCDKVLYVEASVEGDVHHSDGHRMIYRFPRQYSIDSFIQRMKHDPQLQAVTEYEIYQSCKPRPLE